MFTIERMAPGKYLVGLIEPGDSWSLAHASTVAVIPGQTTRVDLAGMGRPVVGRLVPTTGEKWQAQWSKAESWLYRAKADPQAGAESGRASLRFTHWDAVAFSRVMDRVPYDEQQVGIFRQGILRIPEAEQSALARRLRRRLGLEP